MAGRRPLTQKQNYNEHRRKIRDGFLKAKARKAWFEEDFLPPRDLMILKENEYPMTRQGKPNGKTVAIYAME